MNVIKREYTEKIILELHTAMQRRKKLEMCSFGLTFSFAFLWADISIIRVKMFCEIMLNT